MKSDVIRSVLHKTERLGGYIGRAATRELRLRYKSSVQAEFNARLAALRSGDVALDLGANVGVYTARMAETGATVHAFEPDPDTFARLVKRVGHLPNVVLHQKAVGAGGGLEYRPAPPAPGGHHCASGRTPVASADNATGAPCNMPCGIHNDRSHGNAPCNRLALCSVRRMVISAQVLTLAASHL